MLEKKQSGKLLAAEETRALLKLRRERGVWSSVANFGLNFEAKINVGTSLVQEIFPS